jgi:chromosome partitioning protein
MHVMAFASQKGGSGKTTLAGHIAVQAERAGAGPVALIDTDPQGSLASWWNDRAEDTPVFAHTFISQLEEDVSRMRELGIKLLIFDTPPAITTTIEHVIRVCDLVVIPTRPSPHDLRAVGATVDLVDRLGKSLVFVVNGATPRARITAEAAIALSQHGTVAPVTVHQRTDFAASMIDGRTVMELEGADRSAEEMIQLWEYLFARLNRHGRSDSAAPRLAVAQASSAGSTIARAARIVNGN